MSPITPRARAALFIPEKTFAAFAGHCIEMIAGRFVAADPANLPRVFVVVVVE